MCHCTSPKDKKSKKNLQKRTEDMQPTLQCVSIYLFLVWLWAMSLSPWRHCQENNMDCVKKFWIHQLSGFSAPTDRHWASAPLLCGCCGWRSRDAIGGRRCALHPWVFPEQHQANKSSKLRFLCSESGESSNLHFLLGRPDWRGAVMKVVLGNVACCWLVGLKRWDFRRKSEIWDLKESTKKDEL